ncbi:LOW QUALITY PROTEIN: uncharacterized protein LOC129695105 [Leucoraja erinacea]|uniref:LOW QUALITY PROTEIN: uncharacterized protein LOC129695105 n=1 Tax=Leucoraja erinaceus TaxID=7782 RepID=UPI002453ED56|nr:LOW QUALITY PROTEIN: uncharacterized protein LOC129695105 [Leucoraja erinacea]
MAAKDQVESWTEEVVCPICQDFFTDPVALKCGHNFCRSCITQSWDREGRNSCPECREESTERTLRVNRALVRLSEKARTLSLNLNAKKSKLQCEEHQEELKLFCETDKKLICLNCATAGEHKSHSLMLIEEAIEFYKEQVKSSFESLTEKESEIQKMEQKQKESISGVQEESHKLQSLLTSQFAELHQILTEKEQRLLGDVREEEEKIIKTMEKNLQEIQENLNSIQMELSKLQEQANHKDGVIFLKEEAGRKSRVSDETKTMLVVDGALPTVNYDRTFFYNMALRETSDIIKRVSVTLDVETAGPLLEVSEDRKRVRCTRTETRRSLPDTGKTFTDSTCVLGLEGFASGRHYWEVEVAGSEWWSLGVAAESVERKRRVTLTPETGVWSIGRLDDEFDAVTSPPSRLPARPIPRKVGVYLSYESGTVSFYDVDTKSHLHTFTGNKFTEKLYPFFEPLGEDLWLRICSGSAPGCVKGSGPGTSVRSGAQGQKPGGQQVGAERLPFNPQIPRRKTPVSAEIKPGGIEEFTDRTLRVNRPLASLSERARTLSLIRTEKASKLQCEEHQEELKLFCETDKKLVCVMCAAGREHKAHSFTLIAEAAEFYKDQVKASFQSLTKKELGIQQMEQQQKRKISGVLEQSLNLQSKITSQFAELHQILTEKEQRTLADIREEEKKILNSMEKNLGEIQENLKSIQEELLKLQQQMDQNDSVVFLKEEAGRKRKVCDEAKLLSVVDDALQIEKFHCPVFLNTTFKQVSVTLDVETAHPWLEVSEDRKRVRWIRIRRSLPDTAKRFTGSLCVLGSEGFTSGRHYWEVEVAGSRGWRLGLAAESVERKSLVTLTPETGVWSLGLWGDGIDALTSPPSRLPARSIPGRVGIYLSYESGTVSFYDVDTKSHLHTFTENKFTEKLYPFLWPCDGNWLRMCSGSAPGV